MIRINAYVSDILEDVRENTYGEAESISEEHIFVANESPDLLNERSR